MKISRFHFLFIFILFVGYLIKNYFSTANSFDLSWILMPTGYMVSLISPWEYSLITDRGYECLENTYIIAPSCSGINFLIILFISLNTLYLSKKPTFEEFFGNCLFNLIICYLFTIMINSVRIVFSIELYEHNISLYWLTENRIHKFLGILIYLCSLYIICRTYLKIFVKKHHQHINSQWQSYYYSSLPFITYLAIMIGIPLIRSSYPNESVLKENLISITCISIFIIVIHSIRKVLIGFTIVSLSLYILNANWNTLPKTTASFNHNKNALWVNSKYWNGLAHLNNKNISKLLQKCEKHGIKYVFIRAGRFSDQGLEAYPPQNIYTNLKESAPHITFIPWLTGEVSEKQLDNIEWRKSVIQEITHLYNSDIDGIHINIEPIRNQQKGYLDLLKEIQTQFENELFISHAGRRVLISDLRFDLLNNKFWCSDYYSQLMQFSNQTVLMGYNTLALNNNMYREFLSQQTKKLLDCRSNFPDHSLLIGIPAYDHVPYLSNPQIENIKNACLAIRKRCETYPMQPPPLDGISVYSYWHLNKTEWNDLLNYWVKEENLCLF